jgi:hypothetical protein
MEFRMLGPLEVTDDDAVLSLTSAKERALLAILLLNANEVILGPRRRVPARSSARARDRHGAAARRAGRSSGGRCRRGCRSGRRPTLIVRRGLRPGGLAPREGLTRFTWSLSPASA